MNRIFKSPMRVIIACFIICAVIFSGCSRKMSGQGATQKDWVKWSISLKPNASPEEINETLNRLNKYILDYIAKVDPSHDTIKSFDFSYHITYGNSNSPTAIDIWVNLYLTSTGVTRGKPIPPTPPRRGDLPFPDIFQSFFNRSFDIPGGGMPVKF